MKTIIIVLQIAIAASFINVDKTFAQEKTKIKWNETEHDFGQIKEDKGKVTHKFVFENTGDVALVVYNVKASCGCTTPDWSRKPIEPGQKGFVKATFNPKGRKGNFRKSITVQTNAKSNPSRLYIKGVILEREKTLEELYPKVIGDLRLNSTYVNVSRVFNNETKKASLKLVNTGDEPITVNFHSFPKHIKPLDVPKTIKPKERTKVDFEYDATKVNDWDYVTSRFYLMINGEIQKGNRITVGATIEENFSKLSADEIKKSADIKFETETFQFDTMAQGEKVSYEYKFKNTGQSDLKIRKIRASCGCTATSTTKDIIKPGETGSIKTTFNSSHKRGKQYKTITVITNAPKNSKKVLIVLGYVK